MTDPRDAAGKKSAARFGWQWVYLVFPYVWLFFLVFPAMQAWGEHGSRRVMGVTLVTVFAVTYVALFAHLIHDSWLRIDRLGLALCGVLIVVFVLAIDFFTLHGEALVFLPFMLAALMYTLPGRVGAGVGLALLLGTIVLLLSTGMLASSSGSRRISAMSSITDRISTTRRSSAISTSSPASRSCSAKHFPPCGAEMTSRVGSKCTGKFAQSAYAS